MAENRPGDQSQSGGDERRSRRLIIGLGAAVVVLLLIICLGVGWLLGGGKLFGGNATSTPTSVPVSSQAPTDITTRSAATEASTQTVTAPPVVGNGACNAVCDPAKSNCLAGLSCVLAAGSTDKYICWNEAICKRAPTPQPAVCQAGWLPAAGCTCCGTTLVCSNGTVGEFNPKCGVAGYPKP